MLKFQPAFGPSVPPPAYGQKRPQNLLVSPELGKSKYSLNQTFDQIMNWPPAAGDVLRLLFHGGTTWLGIKIGLRDKNPWVSGIAWVLGVGNGLAAIADVVSLIKRATGVHPPEDAERTPVTTPEPIPTIPVPVVVPAMRSF